MSNNPDTHTTPRPAVPKLGQPEPAADRLTFLFNVRDAIVACAKELTDNWPAALAAGQEREWAAVKKQAREWLAYAGDAVCRAGYAPQEFADVIREGVHKVVNAGEQVLRFAPFGCKPAHEPLTVTSLWSEAEPVAEGELRSVTLGGQAISWHHRANDPAAFDRALAAANLEEASRQLSALVPMRPRWVERTRELWMGDRMLFRLVRHAPALIALLNAFQKAGWPETIDNPIPNYGLKDAIDKLHGKLEGSQLRFRRGRGDETVGWGLAPV